MAKKGAVMLRASEETHKQLRVLAALTGETMQQALARLVKAEYERITKKGEAQ